MSIKLFLALFSLVVISTVVSYKTDRILKLPGLDKQPSFKQYAGYLNGSNTDFLFYWFVESQNDPVKDPLVLWLNGGPGCSSINGFLTENGPFTVSPSSSLTYNNFAWNRVANMIYLESPSCVGFSYSSVNNCSSSDDQVAELNYNALRHFLVKYPEFKGRDFFLTGESYAGYYIPTLAETILNQSNLALNFKGVAIGNPSSSKVFNKNSLLHFAYRHTLISESLWAEIIQACCKNENPLTCLIYNSNSMECSQKINESILNFHNINPYNIYSRCVNYKDFQSPDNNFKSLIHTFTHSKFPEVQLDEIMNKIYADWTKYQNIIWFEDLIDGRLRSSVLPCVDARPAINYFNNPKVQEAIHGKLVNTDKWSECNAKVNKDYVRQYEDMKRQYQNMLKQKDLRIWIYNGDVDMICNYIGEIWFFKSFLTKFDKNQKQWHYQDHTNASQVAGFTHNIDRIKLITVRGSGHFVPTDAPRQAFKLFTTFLTDGELN